jgi:outer membrane biosynthesis protein TonB
MKAGSLVLGAIVFWTAGGSALADNPPAGLAGLDVAMNGTGRIGNPWQRSEATIAAPNVSAEASARRHDRDTAAPAAPEDGQAPALQRGDLLEQEYRQTEVAVGNCRVEVARRRQVAPSRVAAGTVRLRFTVEPSGRVRDAEAVSQTGTDLELAACAKRVLSDWRFAKHTAGEITVERVYQLAGVDGPSARR